MTAIAIWYAQEADDPPLLWAAGDSRLTKGGGALLDSCAKILPLHVRCSADSRGLHSRTHSYGYCFAGNSLMGQNSYLLVSPLLTGLVAGGTYLPSMEDVGRFLFAHLKASFAEYVLAQESMFEVALFGWCPTTEQFLAWHFRPALENGIYRIIAEPKQFLKNGDYLYLGDHRKELSAQIEASLLIPQDARRLVRGPRKVIENALVSGQFESIGGDIQLGIAQRGGYWPLILATEDPESHLGVKFRHLGRELTGQLLTVGQAIVASGATT